MPSPLLWYKWPGGDQPFARVATEPTPSVPRHGVSEGGTTMAAAAAAYIQAAHVFDCYEDSNVPVSLSLSQYGDLD